LILTAVLIEARKSARTKFSADCQKTREVLWVIYEVCGKLQLGRNSHDWQLPTHAVDTVSANLLIAEALSMRSIFGQRWRRIREPLGPMKARDEATGNESHPPLPTARSTRPESERLERPAH
jgi:hypothetical protein